MTQSEIDLVYNLTILVFEDPWFKEKKRTRDEVQDWVRKQLGEFGIYTAPIGSGWGHKITKKFYDRYNENKETWLDEISLGEEIFIFKENND